MLRINIGFLELGGDWKKIQGGGDGQKKISYFYLFRWRTIQRWFSCKLSNWEWRCWSWHSCNCFRGEMVGQLLLDMSERERRRIWGCLDKSEIDRPENTQQTYTWTFLELVKQEAEVQESWIGQLMPSCVLPSMKRIALEQRRSCAYWNLFGSEYNY